MCTCMLRGLSLWPGSLAQAELAFLACILHLSPVETQKMINTNAGQHTLLAGHPTSQAGAAVAGLGIRRSQGL
jgi:hypothetical protein